MIPKAPNVNYEVFLMNFNYTCASAKTLDEAIRKAKKTGFNCCIYKSDNPFKIIKWVFAIRG